MKHLFWAIVLAVVSTPALQAQNYYCQAAMDYPLEGMAYFANYATSGTCTYTVPTPAQMCNGTASPNLFAYCIQKWAPNTCQRTQPYNQTGCMENVNLEKAGWIDWVECEDGFAWQGSGAWYICNPPSGWLDGVLRLPSLGPDTELFKDVSDRMASDDFTRMLRTKL